MGAGLTTTFAAAAGAACLLFLVAHTWRGGWAGRRLWWIPAALSAAFAVFSLLTVATEGPLGFWAEHTRNAWGNQIWFDLLLAAAIAWVFIAPRARAQGMHLWPWLAAVVCTGSIGLCAMAARCLFLESRSGRS